MKTPLLFISIIFSVSAFSQMNKNAQKIKRKEIKEYRLFSEKNDSVPSAIIYYDREGRVKKLIEESFYKDSPMSWEMKITEYDTIGRMMKICLRHSLDPDPGRNLFFLDNDQVVVRNYSGDSLTEIIDSVWKDTQLVEVWTTIQTVHWKKTIPPDPRPIYWQDSICSSLITSCTFKLFIYKNLNDKLPEKIETGDSLVSSNWTIENEKLICRQKMEAHRKNREFRYREIDAYTLNDRFDTMTHRYIEEKYALLDNGKRNLYDSTDYKLTTTSETKRFGPWYRIRIVSSERKIGYESRPPLNAKRFERKPWEDQSFNSYYINEVYSDDSWSIEWWLSNPYIKNKVRVKWN